MSPAVIAVQPDAHALRASEVMDRCAVRRVFVTGEDGAPLRGGQRDRPVPRAQGLLGRAGRRTGGLLTGIATRDCSPEEPATTERRPDLPTPVARDLMREIPIVIPFWMSVPAAADMLDAVGGCVSPVVDAGGRCVGVFTPADYRRWLARGRTDVKVVSEWQVVPDPTPEEVCYHMNWRFPSAGPEAGLEELLDRLAAGPDSFLVVLDGRRRPRGIVCALDVLVAEVNLARARDRLLPASRESFAAGT